MSKKILLFISWLLISNITTAQRWKEYYQIMSIYEEKNMIDEALSNGEKAIAAAKIELGEKNADYASIINDVAIKYKNAGFYEKAEPLYLKAAEIRKGVLGDNSLQYASSLNNLAILYRNMEQYKQAEDFFLKSLTILRKNGSVGEVKYAATLNSLGFLYSFTGNYVKAETLLLEGIQLQRKILPKTHPDIATGINALAILYFKIKLLDKAEEYFLQSQELAKEAFGESSIKYASVLSNMADLYSIKGEKNKANFYYNDAIEILKKNTSQNKNLKISNTNQLIQIYINTQDFKEALTLLLLQKDEIKILQGEDNSLYTQCLQSLGFVYSKLNQFENAELAFQQAREITRQLFGITHPKYNNLLYDLAWLHFVTGKLSVAEIELTEFARGKIKNLHSLLNNFSEGERNNIISNDFHLNITNNSFLLCNPKVEKSFYIQNYDIQLQLKSLSLSTAKNTIDILRKNKDLTINKIFSNWQTNKITLAKEYSMPIIKRRKDLNLLEKQTELLEKDLSRKSNEFKNQQQFQQIESAAVQKKITTGEVAIEFVSFRMLRNELTDSIIYAAYILNKNDSTPVFVPLFEEKELQKIIDSARKISPEMANVFYRSLTPDEKTAAIGGLGKDLYKLIWQPLEPYLKGVKKISYSPAGKLYGIAFDALLADTNIVLADKYKLQQLTSTRQVALRENEKQNNKPASIVLFGNANFNMDSLQLVNQKKGNENISTTIYTPQNHSTNGVIWNDLPGTAEEVKKIRELFIKNKIATKAFTETKASEENLKALSGKSPQVLHIATHGFFLPESDKKARVNNLTKENTYTLAEDPLLRSGLILAGGNYAWNNTPIDGVEDGIATAYEISQLNLSNTELVVLSACETALGDVKGSEGVFGLQRAFKMAGVKKMIVSLWQVPDKETAELMTAFYTYWMKGQAINEAFAKAQADMRKKYSPFYWAAFVMVE